MGAPERSRERVEGYLADLNRTYGSVPVSQRTVAVPGERYASVRECWEEGFVDAYARIRNAHSEVLHADGDLPGARVGFGEDPVSRLRRVVRGATGVEPAIDGPERVTIVGVRSADDPDRGTIYHVVVVFAGKARTGDAGEGAEWRRSAEAPGILAR